MTNTKVFFSFWEEPIFPVEMDVFFLHIQQHIWVGLDGAKPFSICLGTAMKMLPEPKPRLAGSAAVLILSFLFFPQSFLPCMFKNPLVEEMMMGGPQGLPCPGEPELVASPCPLSLQLWHLQGQAVAHPRNVQPLAHPSHCALNGSSPSHPVPIWICIIASCSQISCSSF